MTQPNSNANFQIITFMRKLDVKEIHGYDAALGLILLQPAALKKRKPH